MGPPPEVGDLQVTAQVRLKKNVSVQNALLPEPKKVLEDVRLVSMLWMLRETITLFWQCQ